MGGSSKPSASSKPGTGSGTKSSTGSQAQSQPLAQASEPRSRSRTPASKSRETSAARQKTGEQSSRGGEKQPAKDGHPRLEDFDPKLVQEVTDKLMLLAPDPGEPTLLHYLRKKDRTTKFGQLTSWYSNDNENSFMGMMEFPKGWTPVYVHILIRHGSRYPTAKARGRIQAAKKKITEHNGLGTGKSPGDDLYDKLRLEPLDRHHEVLVEKGKVELEQAGQVLLWSYGSLFKDSPPAFQRVDKRRMQQSYEAFKKGYNLPGGDKNTPPWNPPIPKQNEDVTVANPKVEEAEAVASALVEQMVSVWRRKFLPEITERLNGGLKMKAGHLLDDRDTLSIMEHCAFLYASKWTLPEWHEIFIDQDWKHFEYERTIGKCYRAGPGYPKNKGMDKEFVEQILQGLRNRRFKAGGADSKVRVDVLSDNIMMRTLTSLSMFDDLTPEQFPLDRRNDPDKMQPRRFTLSEITPFAARTYIEVLERGNGGKAEHRIRFCQNGRELPIPFLQRDKEGLYSYKDFVNYEGHNKPLVHDDFAESG